MDYNKLRQIFKNLSTDKNIVSQAVKNLENWMEDKNLEKYHPYILHLYEKENYKILLDSFWRMLPFGTGGRRGPVGAGPNRINPHTVSLSVQGHCKYLKDAVKDNSKLKVVIAFDVRQFNDLRGLYKNVDGILNGLTSKDMARTCAMTYAANGVKVYTLGEGDEGKYISTPELSFLIRELGASGGLNISASHNHPDDNGGKFYNGHGGQEIPPDDEKLLKIVEKTKTIKSISYDEAVEIAMIQPIPVQLHKKYIDLNAALCTTSSRSARIAFTPLCGTGMTTVYETLNNLGFNTPTVAGQSKYDGSFKSVRYRIANPEVPESMDELAKLAKQENCHAGFSTDPDADRLGMIVPARDGSFVPLNGNEIGILLLESILSSKTKGGTLPENPIFINTTVTSGLQRLIAKRYGCQVIGDLMVGFKYMGDVLKNLEVHGKFPTDSNLSDKDSITGSLSDFVFTCEESHGYLLTPDIRDKDACGAAVHLAGLTSDLADKNDSPLGMLRNIYKIYGYYRNELRSLVMEGIEGLKTIAKIQSEIRNNPPDKIAGLKVIKFVDNHITGGPLKSSTDEASRNVLEFELDGGENQVVRLVVRPSGTEPKTKIYVEIPSKSVFNKTLCNATKEDLQIISDRELNEIIEKTNNRATEIGNTFIRYCLGPKVLDDIYPDIPDESLMVSDLVQVDHKIRLGIKILPELGEMIKNKKSVEETKQFLLSEIKPFGEDPLGLVEKAVRFKLEKINKEKKFSKDYFKILA